MGDRIPSWGREGGRDGYWSEKRDSGLGLRVGYRVGEVRGRQEMGEGKGIGVRGWGWEGRGEGGT